MGATSSACSCRDGNKRQDTPEHDDFFGVGTDSANGALYNEGDSKEEGIVGAFIRQISGGAPPQESRRRRNSKSRTMASERNSALSEDMQPLVSTAATTRSIARGQFTPKTERVKRISFNGGASNADTTAQSGLESDKGSCSRTTPTASDTESGGEGGLRNLRASTGSRMSFFEMTGPVLSSATQIVIDNPRAMRDIYDVPDTAGTMGAKASVETTAKGIVIATGAIRTIRTYKKALMDQGKRRDVAREIDILRMVDHPNLILLREIFEDQHDISLVFESCVGGALQGLLDSVERLSEVQAAILIQQVSRGVFYLHAKNVCHRDLTPKTIKMATPRTESISPATLFKVGGLSNACLLKSGARMKKEVGNPLYRAPEVNAKSYTQNCDLWSIGVVMYQVLCGRLPFPDGASNGSPAEFNVNGTFKGNHWTNISQGARQLIKLLLEPKDAARYTAAQTLHHKWLNKAVAKLAHIPLQPVFVHNLRTFRSLNKFKRASLLVVASLLDQKETSIPRKIFHLADTNGDGEINVEELAEQIRQSPKIRLDGAESLESFFVNKDSAPGATVSMKDFGYTEFLAATFDRKQCLREDVLWAAFKNFDRNGDGKISFTEFASGYCMGELSLEELGLTLSEVDYNNDGNIDFDDFQRMMLEGVDEDDSHQGA